MLSALYELDPKPFWFGIAYLIFMAAVILTDLPDTLAAIRNIFKEWWSK